MTLTRWSRRLVLACLLGVAACCAAEDKPAKIVVSLDDNYPPYIFRQADGRIDGYLVDVWKLWEQQTGIQVELLAMDWAKAQFMLADGQADVIDTIFRTPEREKRLVFSRPYADLPVPIYAHREIGGIAGPETTRGFLVGVKEGDACAERLKEAGIDALQTYPSYESLVREAAAGSVKVFCLDEAPANYLLYKQRADTLFRKAYVFYSGQLHRAVRKGDENLLQVVQGGFDRIPPAAYRELESKWLGSSQRLPEWVYPLFYVLLAVFLIGSMGMVWGLMLRRQVKLRTQEVEEERSRLHRLINTLPDLVWVKDTDGHYVGGNAEFRRLYGTTETNLIGRGDADFVPPESASVLRERDREAMAAGASCTHEEKVSYASDGRQVTLETIRTPMFDRQGRLVGVLGIGRDITERKRNEENLRLAGRVFDSTAEGIMITDREGLIVAVNAAFVTITGYTAEEVRGRKPSVLRSERHPMVFYQELWAALLGPGVWQGEIWNRRKSGEIYPNWSTISAVRDDNGWTTHYVAVFSDITTVKRSQEAVDFLAHHDPLTGLPNRVLLRDRLEHALRHGERENRQIAVLFIDLDRFKVINDTLGHPVGDEVLCRVAGAMMGQIRRGDTVARLGGDEFVVVLENDASTRSVAAVAQKLVDLIGRPMQVDGKELYVTSSIGISLYPADGRDADSLMKNADLAMYKAKQQGRNNFQFYEAEMGEEALDRMLLENALRGAIQRSELFVHYQPQVDLELGNLAGVEALVRWQHPELGIIPPGRFIPVAEEMGIIRDIGDWVLEEACRQIVRWREAGFDMPRVAVNLSVQQLERVGLKETVARLLADYRIPPEQLELEVTESVIMNRSGRALETLEGLREQGVFLSVDDFGTGYSSLGYLRELPVHRLKIDYSFVRDIGRDINDEAIARAIIALGRSLKLEVVAEGVERHDQEAFLQAEGCDLAQGYLYARPMAPDDVVVWARGG